MAPPRTAAVLTVLLILAARQASAGIVVAYTGINAACAEPTDCAEEHMTCNAEVCECESGFVYDEDAGCVAAINGACETTTDCSAVENAECFDGKCKCVDGFVNIGQRRCLPLLDYGDPCEAEAQCEALGALVSCSPYTYTCSCPTGYHFIGACYRSSNLTENCGTNEHCVVEYSSCQSNVCKCNEGFREDGKYQCVHEKCEVLPGGIFEDGECFCENRDYVIDISFSQCMPVAFSGFGAVCADSAQCQARMGEGAVCVIEDTAEGEDEDEEKTGSCSCEDGYHYLHGYCWSKKGYGEECSADEECQQFDLWDDYACVDGVCACAADAVPKRPGASPLCRRVARENEECESNLDCTDGLLCPSSDTNSLCKSSRSSHTFNSTTRAQKDNERFKSKAARETSDIDCEENEEPSPGGNQCVCKKGYFKPNDESPCLPELGEPCSVGDPPISHIDDAACRRSAKFPFDVVDPDDDDADETDESKNGIWLCIGGYAPTPDKRDCAKTRQHGFACAHDSQCAYYGGVCQETTVGNLRAKSCQCEAEYRYEVDRQLCWPEKVGLDDPCKTDEDCVVQNLGGVECVVGESDGVCQCKDGHRPFDGDCLAIELGAFCNIDTDCQFANGDISVTCKNGECICSNGYNQYNKTMCEFDQRKNCDFIPGAVEDGDKNCVCQDPDNVVDGSYSKCIPVAFEGYHADCYDSVQCLHRLGQGAVCEEEECLCEQGFHYLRGRCWPNRGFDESCTADEECYEFGESDSYVCKDGKCSCAPGAKEIRPQAHPICRRIAREGEECESTLDCEEGADLICDKQYSNREQTICQRAANRASNASVHQENIREEWLLRRRQSLAMLPKEEDAFADGCGLNEELIPSGSDCVCRRGYFRDSTNSECLPELGEPCYVGEENTHIEFASCRRSAKLASVSPDEDDPDVTELASGQKDGVWACVGAFIPGVDNRECERSRIHGFNCQLDLQCGFYGGICVNRGCRCESGYHYVEEKLVCWPSKGLHEECESDADCSVTTTDGVECASGGPSEESDAGECQCKSVDYHEVNGDCPKMAYSLGENCLSQVDCVFALNDPRVECDRQCSCRRGYFQHNSTYCNIGVGGECSSTADCRNVDNARCQEDECACEDGYVRVSTTSCLPIVTEYGGACEDTEQCEDLTPDEPYILCDETCKCWDGRHFGDGKCWLSKYLEDKCDYKSECIVENSECLNNYCSCNYGYIADGKEKCKENSAPSVLAASLAALILASFGSHLLGTLTTV